ncbi:ATP-dependent nuclease [Curtobacterium sp. MCBA15_005]|uniref:ATP-dependent nuclease n=1 Tax=Curtobacterium sp. MCBA15_005 TaxID=1898734 RepID=UPI000B270C7A|nr:AAA family ATPase [Curtobacterium sp. MCBA15_005]NQX22940.1 AAA family ATPase [Curtobacterium sp. VKM Ac-2852]
MRLSSVYARFFRSLNYDYVRLSNPDYRPDPWDGTPTGAHYPFVRLRLEGDITTVVGGNESGKSQVLAAVRAALTGNGYERSDFCRYSPFFSVDRTLTLPEFGAEFRDLTAADTDALQRATGKGELAGAERVALFRMNTSPQLRLYVHANGEWQEPVHVKKPSSLPDAGVPVPFLIDADVPLPDSVPLDYLATGEAVASVGRSALRGIWDVLSNNANWFASKDSVISQADKIHETFGRPALTDPARLRQYELAADLLLKVAGLDREQFAELQRAVRTKNGYANSIVDTINKELSKALNFPHWWSQDSQFELFVALFEYDLVFMIRDRTGRSYGFDERSDGLKYFLSYFVQYLAHDSPNSGRPEILLMDEPDRFLSSSGQQDLLRVFADFADPEDPERTAVQVLYVTHSPFLIDKNHAERIRVLEKGEHDEGTRIVASVAQNHYEPLRSAFGSFVGETAFIGTCNLMLEGPSDQILLAGISSWLGRHHVPTLERLDLNRITLVPAGGVGQVPYLIYLARGRDSEQPAVIALLDGDQAGKDARSAIRRGGARRKPLIEDGLVLLLSDPELDRISTDNPHGRVAIEDLIPLPIAAAATKSYCIEFMPDVPVASIELDVAAVFGQSNSNAADAPGSKGTIDALERAIRVATGNERFEVNKIGFARSVLAELSGGEHNAEDVTILQDNFRLVFRSLGTRQRAAVRAETVDRISSRINRTRDRFLRDHPSTASREHVQLLIEEIEGQLDASDEAEDVRFALRGWRGRFRLDEDPREAIDDFDGLSDALRSVAYVGRRSASKEPTLAPGSQPAR